MHILIKFWVKPSHFILLMENIVFHLLTSSLYFFLFGMINILVSNFVCIGYSNQGSFGCWDQNSIQPHSIKSDVDGDGLQGTQRISKKTGRSQQQKDYKGLECLFCLEKLSGSLYQVPLPNY